MFKKPFKTTNQHLLKSSDKKKLLNALSSSFPNASQEDWDTLLLPKKADIMVHKLASSATLIYTISNIPLFFDISGKGDYYPTIHALVKVPHLMKLLFVNSYTSHYLLAGADLMLPGLRFPKQGIEKWKKGDKRAVMVIGNGIPFAVGEMLCDFEKAKKMGMKGKGLKVIHIFDDYMWKFGKQPAPQGFTENRILPILAHPELEEEEEAEGEEQIEESPKEEKEQEENVEEKVEEKVEETAVEEEKDKEEKTEPEHQSKSEEKANQSNSDQCKHEMDKLLELVFMEAIHHISDEELPADAGSIYNKMINCKPTKDTHIDVKKSSYKKITKFLKEMSKQKLITFKETKNTAVVSNINRSHPRYKSHTSIIHEDKEEDDNEEKHDTTKVRIIDLFKCPSQFAPILSVKGQYDKNQLYTRDEVSNALGEYLKMKGQADKQTVQLDEFLKNNLFAKDKQVDKEATRKQIFRKLISLMTEYHGVIWPDGRKVIGKGKISKIRIVASKIMGNKRITNVYGLLAFGIDIEALRKQLTTKFSTSISVNTKAHKNEPEMGIHGDMSHEFAEYLQQEFNIPSRYITVESLKKKKKK